MKISYREARILTADDDHLERCDKIRANIFVPNTGYDPKLTLGKMMNLSFQKWITVLSLMMLSAGASAFSTYTSESTFLSALNGSPLNIESFESIPEVTATSKVYPLTTVSCTGNTFCSFFFQLSTGLTTDGTKAVYIASPDIVTFSFATPVTAFGIDIRGLGTLGATTLSGTLSSGTSADFYTDYIGTNIGSLFAGIIDPQGFSSISFSSTVSNDGMFFDRMQILVVPEPETYAMILAGLGLLAAFSRRTAPKSVD